MKKFFNVESFRRNIWVPELSENLTMEHMMRFINLDWNFALEKSVSFLIISPASFQNEIASAIISQNISFRAGNALPSPWPFLRPGKVCFGGGQRLNFSLKCKLIEQFLICVNSLIFSGRFGLIIKLYKWANPNLFPQITFPRAKSVWSILNWFDK